MNKKILIQLAITMTIAALGCPSEAAVFFSDNFSNGSTVSSATPSAPTANSTSYQVNAAKSWSPAPSLASSDLRFGIADTSSAIAEVQALFATNAVVLTQNGDYIQLTVTFTNTSGLMMTNCYLGFGLYNSSQVPPVPGGMNGTMTSSGTYVGNGFAKDWQGYVGVIGSSAGNYKSWVATRPPQSGLADDTDNRNQELINPGGSGSMSYLGGATVGSQTPSSVLLTVGAVYTEVLNISIAGINTLAITNTLYAGPDTTGSVVTQFGGVASGSTYLTSGFDSLAIGWYKKAHNSPVVGNTMDIASIQVSGQSTVVSGPPTITQEPVAVTVATNGSCEFSVAATGFNVTYQWQRNGTNLVDGGNISGATDSQLVINNASPADAAAGVNGYYVTVSGAGNYSTNSTTNSLTLVPAKNLVWSGTGSVWDLNTTADWVDQNSNPQTFNYGDAVTFNDTGSANVNVSLDGSFLSASTMTISGSTAYAFNGSGSFAGNGQLIYSGSGMVQMFVANSYTGGTVVSNSLAYLYLQQYQGLGTGPLTLAGGEIEVVPSGSSTLGIAGDVYVNDDSTIQFDGVGSYAGVFLGDLHGAAGKTLTLKPGTASGVNRFRAYGNHTTYGGDLNLSDPSVLFAPYGSSQAYNGIISGPGAMIQKGSTTVLNGANTFLGGANLASGALGLGIDSAGGTDAAVTSGPIGTGPLWLTVDSTTSTTGSAQVFASGGARNLGNSVEYPSGTNNLTLVIGGTNDLTLAGSYYLQGQDGVTSPSITSRTIQVDNTGATTISGVISDSSGANYSFNKTGNGALYLNGANTYPGATTVSAGLLAGSGSVAGSVTVSSGGTIGGGSAAGIGTLSIGGNLTLLGGGSFRVNRAGNASDQVAVTGALANSGSGTITITNLGAPLQVGDTFTLFNKAVSGGAALNVTGGGVAWTNNLALNGTIQVVPSVNTNPTNITFSVSGNVVTLQWPADHTGWHLEVQTNSLATGLSLAPSAWTPVPGSTNVDAVSFTNNPADGAVFYRLVYP